MRAVDVEQEGVGVDDVADFGFVEVAGVAGAREGDGLAGLWVQGGFVAGALDGGAKAGGREGVFAD